jgi:hypothetical protein
MGRINNGDVRDEVRIRESIWSISRRGGGKVLYIRIPHMCRVVLSMMEEAAGVRTHKQKSRAANWGAQ